MKATNHKQRGNGTIDHLKTVAYVIDWAIKLDAGVTKACFACFKKGDECENFEVFCTAESLKKV